MDNKEKKELKSTLKDIRVSIGKLSLLLLAVYTLLGILLVNMGHKPEEESMQIIIETIAYDILFVPLSLFLIFAK
jgi:hypothetical protein